MSARSVLLRLFLSLSLVLNGASAGVAAAHMSAGGGMEAAFETATSASGCPEHHTAAPEPVQAPHQDEGAPDCCKSSACRCACVQLTSTAVLPTFRWAPRVETMAAGRPLPLGQAVPALPHLIRPPIG